MAHVSIKCTIFCSISVEENCIIPFPTLYILVCRECLLKSMYSKLHSGIFYKIEKVQRIYECFKKYKITLVCKYCSKPVFGKGTIQLVGLGKRCLVSDFLARASAQTKLLGIQALLEGTAFAWKQWLRSEHDKLPPLTAKSYGRNSGAVCSPTSDCSPAITFGLKWGSGKWSRDKIVKCMWQGVLTQLRTGHSHGTTHIKSQSRTELLLQWLSLIQTLICSFWRMKRTLEKIGGYFQVRWLWKRGWEIWNYYCLMNHRGFES